MNNISRLAIAVTTLTYANISYATEPAGYYNSCENKGSEALISSLHTLINPHTEIRYGALFDYYPQTDAREDGTIWDMYSTKHWNAGEKCGTYQSMGDCYNKEHSVPKSWFSSRTPMYSDMHHIFPTDGVVNNQRNNYPFGECANGTSIKTVGNVQALGRLGQSTTPGYTGTVFEPDDMYKGDFARAYFYMAACYYNEAAQWKSDMFGNGQRPVFTDWTCDMLLKWHREDPVSDKERDRNDAVYSIQGNRNPFVDYPEMVEYIWGKKTDEVWSYNSKTDPVITTPEDGTVFDFGQSAVNYSVSRSIRIQTIGASETVTLSAPPHFSLSNTQIKASDANNGTEVCVNFIPTGATVYSESMTIQCGNAISTITLTGKGINGIVAKAGNVTESSFTAQWQYCGNDIDGMYSLDVRDESGSIDGYPRNVAATAEEYTVSGLNPSTAYSFTVSTATATSQQINIRTADLIPFIDFLFDGQLFFSTTPGEPSAEAEIIVDAVNIESDITISVAAPFELSLDKTEWTQSITITPDENRFYLRMNSASAGSFSSILKAVAGNYVNDDIIISGKTSDNAAFLEDFEAPAGEHNYSSYEAKTYYGTACTWKVEEAGIWSTDKAYAGNLSMRGSKKATTLLEMLSDKDNGIGTISFYAARWTAKESLPVVEIEVSQDGGATWQSVGSTSFESPDYTLYTFTANVSGAARMRLRQTSGARFNIDNIALSSYSTGVSDPTAERHRWDAFSRDGRLVITVDKSALDLAVYSTDGSTVFTGTLRQGEHSFDLGRGKIVIVTAGDFSRTILIR